MREKKVKYQVRSVGTDSDWITCTHAEEQHNPRTGESNGWLHYSLADGTNGLTKDWRLKPERVAKIKV